MKMKKILLFAAIAVAMLLASCQKEGPIETEKNDLSVVSEPPLFTATISSGTKTTVDATKGKVSWEKTDVITVIDSLSNKAVYEVSSIDNITGKATFVFKSGQTLAEKGPYTATYGEAPKTAQTYSETPGNLCMTAPATLTNSFNFTVNCGLLEINLTKNGEFVKSIAVSNNREQITYTLTCNPEKDISQKETFYISVNGDTYYKIVITDKDGKECVLKAAYGIKVDINHIKPVTFSDKKLVFKPNTLSGVFSVSDNKYVQFSKGNLYWDETNKKFGFEANQYDFQDKWFGTYCVSHFYWSKTASVTYRQDYNDSGKQSSDVFFTNTTSDTANKDFTVNGVTGKYRTLSWNEWQYLFGSSEARDERYQYPVTVCGIAKCMVLAPDNFEPLSALTKNVYSSEEWAKAEEKGLVCLPPASIRDGSVVDSGFIGNGYYWSSTSASDSQAYCMGWIGTNDSSKPPTFADKDRNIGRSVRLVTDVNQ